MKLSTAQQRLHWRLWSKAKDILLAQSPDRSIAQCDADAPRHALYMKALGQDKSLTEMGNDDFDLVLGALRAVIDPGNLRAQLHALTGQRQRLLFGIRKLAKSIGVDDFYVQAIVTRMDADGSFGGTRAVASSAAAPPKKSKTEIDVEKWQAELHRAESGEEPRRLEDLSPDELVKVMIALRQHERRGTVRRICPSKPLQAPTCPFCGKTEKHCHFATLDGPIPVQAARILHDL